MAFVPVPNGMSLCFHFTTANQNWQFCLTLRKSAGPPQDTDLQQAAGDGYAWWSSFLKGRLVPTTSLTDITVADLTEQGAPQYVQTVGEAGTETSSDSLPLNAAIVISARTAKRGRSFRGRNYLSGWGTNPIEGLVNQISGAYAASLAAGWEDLRDTLDGHGYDHVIASRTQNGVPLATAEVNEVVAYVVDTLIDSQRRRLSGRGT